MRTYTALDINPVDLIKRTAQVLAGQAIEGGESAQDLALTVLKETDGVMFMDFESTALLRLIYQELRTSAMTTRFQHIAMLREAACILEDVYYAKIRKED